MSDSQISNHEGSGSSSGQENQGAFSKRASALDLAVYCDTQCTPLRPPSPSSSPLPLVSPHRYVLHPTSASLVLHRHPVPTPSTPQLRVDVHLTRLHVAVSRSQVDRLSAMHASFRAVRLREEVSRWRPRQSPSRDPRAWWRYAYHCIRVKQGAGRAAEGRGMDWPRLVYVVTRRQRYIDFYKRRVAPDLYSPLAQAEEEELRRMEDRLHVAEIVYFRTLADAEVHSLCVSNPNPNPNRGCMCFSFRKRMYKLGVFLTVGVVCGAAEGGRVEPCGLTAYMRSYMRLDKRSIGVSTQRPCSLYVYARDSFDDLMSVCR